MVKQHYTCPAGYCFQMSARPSTPRIRIAPNATLGLALALFLAGAGGPVHAASADAGGGDAASRIPGHHDALPRPGSWSALLAESRASGRPVVALFSTRGCAWCDLLRRDHLRHLARDAKAAGVIVVEFDMFDRRPFGGAAAAGSAYLESGSPAELARTLGIRVAPTVVFLGPEGEIAERLIGYQSADFYGAYLSDRIADASAALKKAVPGR